MVALSFLTLEKPHFMHATSDQPRSPWIQPAFWIFALITIGMFFIPAFVILPFRYQSPRALWLAIALRQRGPVITVITATLSTLLALFIWRASGRWHKVLLAAGLALVVFSATMARLNYFEWMFHPVRHYGFTTADRAKLEASEMVLALSFNGDSRAYPVREMA